jgi:hypothetical protein
MYRFGWAEWGPSWKMVMSDLWELAAYLQQLSKQPMPYKAGGCLSWEDRVVLPVEVRMAVREISQLVHEGRVWVMPNGKLGYADSVDPSVRMRLETAESIWTEGP